MAVGSPSSPGAAPPGQQAAAAGAGAGQQGPADPFVVRLQGEGLPDEALAYLRARGLLFERRLAAVASTQAELVEIIITRLRGRRRHAQDPAGPGADAGPPRHCVADGTGGDASSPEHRVFEK